jgi:peptidoglycan/xylan/chitin deacetylase (PgdA/CDA1 family)
MLTGSAMEHAHLRGQDVVMWSADRGPAADDDTDGVRRYLVDHLQPGAIIDLHDGVGASANLELDEWPAQLIRRRTTEIQALPDVLHAGASRGIRFVTLSQLVALAGS